MVLFFFLSLVISVAYAILISAYLLGWSIIPVVEVTSGFKPQTFISIVISVRNEEDYIQECIQSILLVNYPKTLFEIIIVNDHSTDDTLLKIGQLHSKQIRCFSLINTVALKQGKKEALLYGIQQSKGEFIVTTDGDCMVEKNWLLHFAYQYEKLDKKCLTGMVRLQPVHTFVEYFQALDNLATMGVNATANYFGWHYAGNGANLGFEKNLFFQVGAYGGNEQFASGDDMFLIQKIAILNRALIGPIINQENIVNTKPEQSWRSLFEQRIRWATKTSSYKDKRVLFIYAFLFLFQCLLISNLALSLLFGGLFLLLFIIQLLIKLVVDYLFINKLSSHFSQMELRKAFLKSFIYLVPFYFYLSIKALKTKSYVWKDRIVK